MRVTRENDRLRLQHMSDAAKYGRRFAEGKTRRELEEDPQFHFALARAVEIVCEAACNITTEFKTANPQIAWKQITGMRQWLAHAYFKIDLDVLWKTTIEDLPPLLAQLDDLLASEDEAT